MPTKIRLQRRGRKARPFYHIVIADGRAPRDGKFIEKIGTYNPISQPADIQLNFDRALYWLQSGAQPTDTVRTILSYKGVLYKNHLLNGVKKGALTEEQVEIKFQTWLKEKESKIEQSLKDAELAEKDANKKAGEAPAEEAVSGAPAEAPVEETKSEEPAAEAQEEVKEEKAEEDVVAEEKEEKAEEEVKEEKAEEAPEAAEEKEEEKSEPEAKEEVKEEAAEAAPEEEKEEKAEEAVEEKKEEPEAEEVKEEPKAEEEEDKEEKK